jgi:hypothetical protein
MSPSSCWRSSAERIGASMARQAPEPERRGGGRSRHLLRRRGRRLLGHRGGGGLGGGGRGGRRRGGRRGGLGQHEDDGHVEGPVRVPARPRPRRGCSCRGCSFGARRTHESVVEDRGVGAHPHVLPERLPAGEARAEVRRSGRSCLRRPSSRCDGGRPRRGPPTPVSDPRPAAERLALMRETNSPSSAGEAMAAPARPKQARVATRNAAVIRFRTDRMGVGIGPGRENLECPEGPDHSTPNMSSRRLTGRHSKESRSSRSEPRRRPCIPSPVLVSTRKTSSSYSSRPNPRQRPCPHPGHPPASRRGVPGRARWGGWGRTRWAGPASARGGPRTPA